MTQHAYQCIQKENVRTVKYRSITVLDEILLEDEINLLCKYEILERERKSNIVLTYFFNKIPDFVSSLICLEQGTNLLESYVKHNLDQLMQNEWMYSQASEKQYNENAISLLNRIGPIQFIPTTIPPYKLISKDQCNLLIEAIAKEKLPDENFLPISGNELINHSLIKTSFGYFLLRGNFMMELPVILLALRDIYVDDFSKQQYRMTEAGLIFNIPEFENKLRKN